MTGNPRAATRRERKKEQTRDNIIKVALSLFRAHGFDATTMEQIAEEADVAKATLYKYFPNKEAIVGSYMEDEVQSHEPNLRRLMAENNNTRDRLASLLRQMFRWNEINRDMVSINTAIRFRDLENNYNRRASGLEQVLAKVFRAGQEEGEIRRDLSDQKLAAYFRVFYLVPFMIWHDQCSPAEQEQSIEETIDLFLRGARRDK